MDAQAMNQLTYGLFVLTARQDGKDNGCIVNTVQQVTAQPNRISVAVNKMNLTHDMILATGEFNVSVLSEKAQFALFQRFGFQSGRDADKFAGFADAATAANGIRYVTADAGANTLLGAKVCQTVDLGTHTLFLAEVTDARILSRDASVTYSYYHAHIKPQPGADRTGGGQKDARAGGGEKGTQTVWRCRICGYEYVGETLPEDYICPVCKHPASDFEKV